jgi:LCP family protein required for cell wall assembly
VVTRLPFIDAGISDAGIGKDRVTVLIMGMDTRPQQNEAISSRTDTMFVLTMDPKSKTAGILSIPRDMWVTIPGSGDGRINEAFGRGGPPLAMRTVEETLGIKVQYYVIVDFLGFTKIIDTLGGITVDVPERIRQDDYSPDDAPYHFTPKDFQPGLQHMNGEDALAYSRIRLGTSDLDRIRRQQLVMFAVMDKVMDLKLLPIAFDLWKRYRDTVTTNINDVQAAGLIKLAADIGGDNVVALSLGPAMSDCNRFGGQVLCWNRSQVQTIVSSVFLDRQLVDEHALIEVQNGTARPGMASNAVTYLTGLGLPPAGVYTSNVRPSNGAVDETVILDYSGKPYTAQKLAEWLGLPSDRIRAATPDDESLRSRNDIDIVLIVGTDAKITQAQRGS